MSARHQKNKSSLTSSQQSQASLYQPVDKIDLRAESPRDRPNSSHSGDRRRESSRNRDSGRAKNEKQRLAESSKDLASLRIVDEEPTAGTSHAGPARQDAVKLRDTQEFAQQKRSESRGVVKVKLE